MSTHDLLGALAQYVLTNDEVSRLVLADALKEYGQHEAGKVFGEGAPYYLVEQPDPYFGDPDNVREYDTHYYHTQGEKDLAWQLVCMLDPGSDKVVMTLDEDEARDRIGLEKCDGCGEWFDPLHGEVCRGCYDGE